MRATFKLEPSPRELPPEAPAPAPSRKAKKRAELADYYAEREDRDARRYKGVWLSSWLPAIRDGRLSPFQLRGIWKEPGMSPIGAAIAGFVALAFYLEGKTLVCSHREMADAVSAWFQSGRGRGELLKRCSVGSVRFWWRRFKEQLGGYVEGKAHFGPRQHGPGHTQLANSYAPGLLAWAEVKTALARRGKRPPVKPPAKPLTPVVSPSGELQSALPARAHASPAGAATVEARSPQTATPAEHGRASAPSRVPASPAPALPPSPTPTPASAAAKAAGEGKASPEGPALALETSPEAAQAARGDVFAGPARPPHPEHAQAILDALHQPAPFRSPAADRAEAVGAVVRELEAGVPENPWKLLGALVRR